MNKTEIAKKIMAQFEKSNSKIGHIIDNKLLNFNVINNLNPKEQGLVNQAIEELVNLGYVETDTRNGTFCLVLTEQGFNEIYPINEKRVIDKISGSILDQFVKMNSKPNHIIDSRWLQHVLINSLNPKERELVNKAIDKIVTEGLVKKGNRNGTFCIILTEQGFEEIY